MSKLKLKKPEIKGQFKTRKSKSGSYSVLLTVIVIAIAVIVNLVVAELPSKYTNVDLSPNKMYSIGDETKNVVKNLNTDVKIYVLAAEESADGTISELLNRYKDLSDHISVEYVDPVLSPGFASNYGETSIASNSLIVESEKRHKVVSYNDIYVVDYSSYYSTGTTEENFDGEGQLTSAIAYVTSETLPVVYSITGHGESSLGTVASDVALKQNVEVKDLNLLSEGAVPEDADAVLIYAPTSDYSSDEADMLISYLEAGGAAFIMTNYTTEDMTNFNRILDNYGVSLSQGVVVEGDQSAYYMDPLTILPTVNSHDITSDIKSGQTPILILNAQAVNKNETVRSTVTIKDLLTTSDSSYEKTPVDGKLTTYEKEDGDRTGSFPVAVAISEDLGDGNTTQIVLCTSAWLLQDTLLSQFNISNTDLFANSLGWMCEQESTVNIPVKSTSIEYIMVPAAQVNLWSSVCIIILPAALLIAGLIIWLWRRKK